MGLALLKQQKLGWEIAVSLLIKFAIIYFLWWMFFSDPIDKHLTGSDIANVLFGSATEETADTANPSINPKEK